MRTEDDVTTALLEASGLRGGESTEVQVSDSGGGAHKRSFESACQTSHRIAPGTGV
jgi:hypothetical protein